MTNQVDDQGLAYMGRIVELQSIPNADFILSATVVCGPGGKWRGVVRKADFQLNDTCVVFLPDAQLNENDHPQFSFMKDSGWRVKMKRFKGVPSEVLIAKDLGTIPYITGEIPYRVGRDVTACMKVVKYHKPIPAGLQGIAKGNFPSFIPKTDELNYQRYPELVDSLVGKPYYVTEKADGSSTTAYKYKGVFGVCSRNLDLERNEDNGYWKIAIRYNLEEKLPEGYALQWETVGPGIQGNPMGWNDIQGLAFSAYNIPNHRYLDMGEFLDFCDSLGFPHVQIYIMRQEFEKEGLESLGEGFYDNKKPREGVVVRSQEIFNGKPISFKVINLGYEK
jgi:RNA ligase (TIGR02306 family)